MIVSDIIEYSIGGSYELSSSQRTGSILLSDLMPSISLSHGGGNPICPPTHSPP